MTNSCLCAENSPAWLRSLGICGLAGARSFLTDLRWLEFSSWPLAPLLQRCGNPQAAPKHSRHDCLGGTEKGNVFPAAQRVPLGLPQREYQGEKSWQAAESPALAEAAGLPGSAASAGGGLSLGLGTNSSFFQRGAEPGPAAPRDRGVAAPALPGTPALPGGTGASFSPGITCSPCLGCFQTVLLGEEVNAGCRSPFAAEGRGSGRSGCVGNSRGQIPSPGAGAGRAQPTPRGGRGEPQGLAGGKARDRSCSLFSSSPP